MLCTAIFLAVRSHATVLTVRARLWAQAEELAVHSHAVRLQTVICRVLSALHHQGRPNKCYTTDLCLADCCLQNHSPSSPLSTASKQQSPSVGLAGEAVPPQVWQLCGVSANLQATNLTSTADALLQLDSVHCPLEVVTCLQHANQAIAQAVAHIR